MRCEQEISSGMPGCVDIDWDTQDIYLSFLMENKRVGRVVIFSLTSGDK